jgi:DNA-binding XRE family transcriptional regulator
MRKRRSNSQHVGQKIRKFRINAGLTQKKLASVLGYSTHTYLTAIEAGDKKPTLDLVLKVAALFHLSLDSLLVDEIEHAVANSTRDKRGQAE